MGGRGKGRSRTQRKHFRDGRENVWKRSKSDPQQQEQGDISTAGDKPTPTHWQPFETQNPAFDDYYKEQELVALEEWDSFIGCLRKPLPAAFRINSSSQFCSEIRSQLENDFMISLQAEGTDGGEAEGIKPLHWYPENLAWQSSFSRMQLRKNQTLERFHQFLKQENEIGNITRQEAVSMVPPLFLDVSPDHFVLDMCAAPGSKTFQLLEMIHWATGTGSLPTGMVIANDLDVQRCNLLIHQTKRMCTANLIVTNHEAQHFPSCHTKKEHANVSETSINQLLFDRVLCDVPCSGDGTLRKAPDIWKKWSVGNGNGLHCLQIQIALRGLSLLKIGGKMVYSTCSMNPVENEAVVAEILRRCGESVELLDVSTELPKLVRRPGLKKWKIRDKGMWLASYKDVRKFRRTVIVPSMFPSGESFVDPAGIDDKTAIAEVCDNGSDEISANVSEVPEEDQTVQTDALVAEVSTLPLERCMRIVPHDQNTGAFFIAVFQKLTPLPASQLKPVKPHRQLNCSNDNKTEKLEDEVKEQSNGMEVDLTDVTDETFPEAIVDADVTDELLTEVTTNTDLLDNESKETLAIDPSQSPTKPESQEVKATDEKGRGKRKLQSQGKWKGVDPVVFLEADAIVDGIKSFYGIKDDFPFNHHLITRNTDMKHVKRIYYVSNSVKDVLELNFLGGQQLKITSIGLKMFERQTSREGTDPNCAFRISSEGLPLLLPYMTKQILFASPVDFKHLLQDKIVKFGDFVDTEFGEKASKLKMGCCAVVLKKGDETLSDTSKLDSSTIAISCWRGRTNIAVMVTAIDCQELLERLLVRMETETDSSSLTADKPLVNCKDEMVKMTDTEVKQETEINAPA